MSDKVRLSFREYMRLQIQEITTGFNRWVTGINLDKDPTDEECAKHYARNKGMEDFNKRHEIRTD